MASTTTNLGLTKIDSSDYISPDPINDAFDTIDKLGVGYITALGESNGWQYVKLSNGFAMCAATSTGATTSGTQSYNVKKTYPFAFSETPRLVATGGVSGVVGSGIKHVGNDKTIADAWIGTDSSDAGRSWWIHIIAFGKVSG